MSKIKIISQAEQGVVIDVSGCSGADEARAYLRTTLQVSSQFWQGLEVDLNLGQLHLSTDAVCDMMTILKEVGVAPRYVNADNPETRRALKDFLNSVNGVTQEPATIELPPVPAAKLETPVQEPAAPAAPKTRSRASSKKSAKESVATASPAPAVTGDTTGGEDGWTRWRESAAATAVVSASTAATPQLIETSFEALTSPTFTAVPAQSIPSLEIVSQAVVSPSAPETTKDPIESLIAALNAPVGIQMPIEFTATEPADVQSAGTRPVTVEMTFAAPAEIACEGPVTETEPAVTVSEPQATTAEPTVIACEPQTATTETAVTVSEPEATTAETEDKASEPPTTDSQPARSETTATSETALPKPTATTIVITDSSMPKKPAAPAPVDRTPAVLFLKQHLRSGQAISHKGHLVIIGDVNNGAEVTAEGDITIWGTLRGTAHAGAAGDTTAEIRALRFEALQLRIAHAIARSPDRTNFPTRGIKVPETARIVDGKIRISCDPE